MPKCKYCSCFAVRITAVLAIIWIGWLLAPDSVIEWFSTLPAWGNMLLAVCIVVGGIALLHMNENDDC